ncbi:S9 family peptidase [bacterium]|nr:S9 family peptidase [bacterium]
MNSIFFSRKSILFWGMVLLCLSLVLPVHSYTLPEVLSYAFPSNLCVSPQGDEVAWVFNRKGKRNIWIAQGPEYQPVQLTHYEFDDGQPLSDLAFGSEGKVLFYVRGGAPNRAGEHPNPTSDPERAEQAVWAIHREGKKPWRIGEGHNPVPSPSDQRVVYSLKGQIFLSNQEKPSQPEILFETRGRNSSPRWAPDGSKLAFVSHRGDHSFIGVYDFQKNSISWISPSVDRDVYPVWSPCGKYIAFIRFPGKTFPSFRGGKQFSLMVADIQTMKASSIWRCPNKTGGFSQYYPQETLRWAAEGHLVFYSEHEGWMHLYSISVKEKNLIPLTPGEYEVENSFLSPDRTKLVFNSNRGDMDRRHLWSVSVEGGKVQPVTSGKGLEWSPVLTTQSEDLIFLCSTARQPAAPAILNSQTGEKRLLAPQKIPEKFPTEDLVKPQQVVFESPDGLDIHGQLFLPHGAKPGDNRAAVIFMHGGPIRQMMLGWHMRGYYHNAYAMNQYLTHKGFVVLSVNYRSGIGYGYDFRTAENQGPRGASEYQDIVAAGKYLQKRPEVNPHKIGLWGGSYGGYLTALGLARDSELFAAGVDLHGVHDWSLRARRRDGGGWGIRGEDLMSSAYQSSPVADVEFWYSPVLFVHGDDDRNVDFVQTTDLVQRLRKSGKAHVELLVIPDEVHGFLRHGVWLRVYKKAANFFSRFLQN